MHIRWGLCGRQKNTMKTETLFSSKSNEWETPEAFFQELDKEFNFDLDACASDDNHKCDKYFTAEDDGLTKNWQGHTVWCNPPYSNVKEWIRKCYYEGHKPNTTVVALVFSRTDTKWWWNYVQHRAEVRFVKGRIKFGGKANAPFPSALVIYRGPEEEIPTGTNDSRQMTWSDYEKSTNDIIIRSLEIGKPEEEKIKREKEMGECLSKVV